MGCLYDDLPYFRLPFSCCIVLSCKICVAIPKFTVLDRKTVNIGVFRIHRYSVFFGSGVDVILHDDVIGCVRAPDPILYSGQSM